MFENGLKIPISWLNDFPILCYELLQIEIKSKQIPNLIRNKINLLLQIENGTPSAFD